MVIFSCGRIISCTTRLASAAPSTASSIDSIRSYSRDSRTAPSSSAVIASYDPRQHTVAKPRTGRSAVTCPPSCRLTGPDVGQPVLPDYSAQVLLREGLPPGFGRLCRAERAHVWWQSFQGNGPSRPSGPVVADLRGGGAPGEGRGPPHRNAGEQRESGPPQTGPPRGAPRTPRPP